MKTIHNEWQTFSTLAIPDDAPDMQRSQLQTAFYCGVMAMFTMVSELGEDNITDDQANQQMESLAAEIEAYQQEFLRRHGIKIGPLN